MILLIRNLIVCFAFTLIISGCSTTNTTNESALVEPEEANRIKEEGTNQILLFLAENTNIDMLAEDYQLKLVSRLQSDINAYILKASNHKAANIAKQRLQADRRVKRVFLNKPVNLESHYYAQGPYVRGLWHLKQYNLNQNWPNINVSPAWGTGITGLNAGIGIVDSGVEFDHPDLANNYVPMWSRNFTVSYPEHPDANDPSPWQEENNLTRNTSHGTAVAGISSANGRNAIGLTGVAPSSRFAALRVALSKTFNTGPANNLTPYSGAFIDAIYYQNLDTILIDQMDSDSSFSHGLATATLKIKNHSYGSPKRFHYDPDSTQARLYALNETTNAGMIHVTSAGNYRQKDQKDTNKSDLGRSTDLIFVSAVNCTGRFSDYSNFGSNIVVSAPSSNGFDNDEFTCAGTNDYVGILTTDVSYLGYNFNDAEENSGAQYLAPDPFLDAQYASQFGGTSAAAPIVSGVIALGVQVNPDLTTRFVKHLFAKTSKKIDPENQDWISNAAGYNFNRNYGFGLIDASRFVSEINNYSGVSERTNYDSGLIPINRTIPNTCDDSQNKCFLEEKFTYTPNPHNSNQFNQTKLLEEVIVTLDIQHPYRGILSATIISPSRTKSQLFSKDSEDSNPYDNLPDAQGIDNWPFVTNAFWGENPEGEWAIRLHYEGNGNEFMQTPADVDYKWKQAGLQLKMGHLLLN